ncbi:hypothetical protein D9M73_230830 [compost metagenome]
MVEITGEVALHADGLHDFLRRRIFAGGKRHHFIQPQLAKGAAQSRPCRFAGKALAPMALGQAPANFDRRGKCCIETDVEQAGETNEGTAIIALQGP